jgi:hypothetical protein
MALKSDREVRVYDITFYMNETAEKGQLVVHNGTGSGAAMDQSVAKVTAPTTAYDVMSGVPVGLLLCDVVNIDQTKFHINQHKDEVQVGGKVTIMKQGWVVTDNISGTPSPGSPLHYNELGQFTTVTDSARIGRFLSSVDADGYCKIEINLP